VNGAAPKRCWSVRFCVNAGGVKVGTAAGAARSGSGGSTGGIGASS
jgi:hypothetical protein